MSVILFTTWIQKLQSRDKAASKVQITALSRDKSSAPSLLYSFFLQTIILLLFGWFVLGFFWLCNGKLYKELIYCGSRCGEQQS